MQFHELILGIEGAIATMLAGIGVEWLQGMSHDLVLGALESSLGNLVGSLLFRVNDKVLRRLN